jgi:hypothetical protein
VIGAALVEVADAHSAQVQRSLAIESNGGTHVYGIFYEAFDDHIGARRCGDDNKATRRLPKSVPAGNGDGLCDPDAVIHVFIEADDLPAVSGDNDCSRHRVARRGLSACATAAVVNKEGNTGTGGLCGDGKGKGANSAHDGERGSTVCHGIPRVSTAAQYDCS